MALQGIYDAKHWRDRAAEMRALSGEMKDFVARTLMLKLANDYDKIADRADRTRMMVMSWVGSPIRSPPKNGWLRANAL